MFRFKHEMHGEVDYPEKGIISDEEVWQLVKKHSRLIDRLSNRKMVEMTIAAQHILFGIYETEGWYAKQDDWTFYGKEGFFTYATDNEKEDLGNMKDYFRKP